MTFKSKNLFLALFAFALSPSSWAKITAYENASLEFISQTQAHSIGPLPSSGHGTKTVGAVTFSNGPGGYLDYGNFSNEIAGYDFGLSGNENFNLIMSLRQQAR